MRYSFHFVLIVSLFITSLITANIVAVKLVSIGSIIFPAGLILFPISYIAGDVIAEVYGYNVARKVIWLGFLCNFIAVVSIMIAQILPPASFWYGQEAYEQILGFTPRLLLASFVAYILGEHANAYVLVFIKSLTGGRWLWMRTIGSTIVGQGVDSLAFVCIAFIGIYPFSDLTSAIITQWLMKSGYEALMTPATYWAVRNLKIVELQS